MLRKQHEVPIATPQEEARGIILHLGEHASHRWQEGEMSVRTFYSKLLKSECQAVE